MKLISVFMFLVFCVADCSTKNIQTDHQGKLNSVISIELKSNPTTGYTWKWANREAVTIVDSVGFRYVPDSDRIGSGGIEIWKFQCKKKGTEVIRFKYNRSWDPDSTIEQKEITITVK